MISHHVVERMGVQKEKQIRATTSRCPDRLSKGSALVLFLCVLMSVPAPSWQTTRLLSSPARGATERLFFIHGDVDEDRLHVLRESCCQHPTLDC